MQYMVHRLLIHMLNNVPEKPVSRRLYTGAQVFYIILNIVHLEELLSNYSLSISEFQKRRCLIDCPAQE